MSSTVRTVLLPVVASLLLAGMLIPASAAALTPLPFDNALSIYVGHNGTWSNYSTGQQQAAEIEDPLAAFPPDEAVRDHPAIWYRYRINLAPVPEGWTFFAPVAGRPMQLHVVVRDAQGRLGDVMATDRATGAWVGRLSARAWVTGEIDGWLPVDPACEALDLRVTARDGGRLLASAIASNPAVDDAVVVALQYYWQPNSGIPHDRCAISSHPEGPPGDPLSIAGKTTLQLEKVAVGCAGPVDFVNDAPDCGVVKPRFPLKSEILADTTDAWERASHAPPRVLQQVRADVAAMRHTFDPGRPGPQPQSVRPYSRGTAHWYTVYAGQTLAVIAFPYRGPQKYRRTYTAYLNAEAQLYFSAKGLGQSNPSAAVAESMRREWSQPMRADGNALAPIAVGDLWYLRICGEYGIDINPCECVTAPVTFELWASTSASAPGNTVRVGGRATAEIYRPISIPAPPIDFPGTALQFPAEGEARGTCTVNLAKGWRWRVRFFAYDSQHNPAYPEGISRLIDIPETEHVRFDVRLTRLLTLKVFTRSRLGDEPCTIELGRQLSGGGEMLDGRGDTQAQADGRQVWEAPRRFVPGNYRVRARSRIDAEARWSDWQPVRIDPGVEQTVTVIVPK
jgi:hypothetical protein